MLNENKDCEGCTISYFIICHPSDKCLFNSVGSNSSECFPFFNSSLNSEFTFTTNTFFILFIIKVKIIISAVGFGSAKLTANVLQLTDVALIMLRDYK